MARIDNQEILLLISDFFEEIYETKSDLQKLYENLPPVFYTLKKYDDEKVFNEILLATNGFSFTGEDITIQKDELFKKFLADYPEFNIGKSRELLFEEVKKSREYIHREYRQLKMYMVYVYTLLDEVLLNFLKIANKRDVSGVKSKIKKLGFDNFENFPRLKLFNAERNVVIHAYGKYNERNINLIDDKNIIEELNIYEGKDVELSKEKVIGYIELSKEFIKFVQKNIERI